jgi:hypothetical protein
MAHMHIIHHIHTYIYIHIIHHIHMYTCIFISSFLLFSVAGWLPSTFCVRYINEDSKIQVANTESNGIISISLRQEERDPVLGKVSG